MSSVDMYAKDIRRCANKLVDGMYHSPEKIRMVSAFAICISSFSTLSYYFNPIYHLSGFASSLVDRVLDSYSTYKVSKYFENTRFFEYGLDKFYHEANPFLPEHPTKKDLFGKMSFLREALVIAASTIFPPLVMAFSFPHIRLMRPILQ